MLDLPTVGSLILEAIPLRGIAMFHFKFSDLDSLYLHSMYDSVGRWVDGTRVAADPGADVDQRDDRVAADAGRRQAHTNEADHV